MCCIGLNIYVYSQQYLCHHNHSIKFGSTVIYLPTFIRFPGRIKNLSLATTKINERFVFELQKTFMNFFCKPTSLIKLLLSSLLFLHLKAIYLLTLFILRLIVMKGLAIWIFLILQMAECKWCQDGHWTRELFSNNSFLFTFLGVEEGYVQMSGFRYSTNLRILLSQKKGSDRSILIDIKMISERYQTDQIFHAKNFSIKTNFQSEDGTTYAQKEVQIINNLFFNITLTHRKQLELRSTEGVFTIKLINVEEISPRIYYYLWLLLALMVGLGHFYHVPFYIKHKNAGVLPTLGLQSGLLINAWLIRFLYYIFDQSYYITDTISAAILTAAIFVSGSFFALEMIGCGIVLIGNIPRYHSQFTSATVIMAVLLMVPLVPLRLWYFLPIVVAYEILTMFYWKDKDATRKCSKIIALGILYLFPCFIFPWFSFEMQYPQEEAELWWLYGVFYLVEVAVFLLKAFGGAFKLKRLIRLKRLIKLKAQKRFNSSAYLELQEKACPLCLKDVQVSEIGMSPAGEAPQVDWIQAQCSHHFHKACVRQSMQEIDCCLFDKTLWTDEFKKSAQE